MVALVNTQDVLDIAIGAISTQLDAFVAARTITHGQLSLLPSAEHYPIVDFAVRAWATLVGAKIAHSSHVHPELRHNGGPFVIATYSVSLRGEPVVTVHKPQELIAEDERPAPEGDAATAWSPSHQERQ